MPERVAKRPPEKVRQWTQKVLLRFRYNHLRKPSDETLVRLGALVSLVGDLEDEDACDAFGALTALFCHESRQNRWSKAVEEIPPTWEAVLRIRNTVQAFRAQVTKAGGESISSARFRLDRVVGVMVQVTNPESYVEDCWTGGLQRVGAIFHPNTFENSKRKFRGANPNYDTGEDESTRVVDKAQYVVED